MVAVLDEVLSRLDEAAQPRIVLIQKGPLGGREARPLEKLLGHQAEAFLELEARPLREDRVGDHDVVDLVLAPDPKTSLSLISPDLNPSPQTKLNFLHHCSHSKCWMGLINF